MLEWYRAFAGVEDDDRARPSSSSRTSPAARCVAASVRIAIAPAVRAIYRREAFARHARMTEDDALRSPSDDEDRFFRVMVDEVEPALAAGLDRGVFVTEYPASQASLARKKPGDPRVAERFEFYVARRRAVQRLRRARRSGRAARALRARSGRSAPRGACRSTRSTSGSSRRSKRACPPAAATRSGSIGWSRSRSACRTSAT